MGVTNFSDLQFIRLLGTNEEAQLGSFSTARDYSLQFLRVLMYKQGTEGGSETFRLNMYGDSDFDTPIFQSSSAALADGNLATNFFGWIRFDFDDQHLNDAVTYYPTIEMSSYTMTDSFFLSYVMDWPVAINTVPTNELAAQMLLYGKEC